MEQHHSVLGVDFGGVIQGGAVVGGVEDTTFLTGGDEAAMATPEVPGAFLALARLTKDFEGRVWIVSKCGPRVEARTWAWLEHHDFFAATGIDPSHLRFCRQRSEKADRCRELAVSHFIDDRSDVLEHLAGVVAHRFLFGVRADAVPEGAVRVKDWEQAVSRVRGTLAQTST